ncbi:hypothetical protein FHX80_112035 [Streptomyces brevispora]|uniref:Uncharacterized protein n=1 Tax=Streptomyces brevispora TaxID=887462 RepID=A0A561UW58_9ACTN|nr:hypothetical protein FHX80_112035 [Streptomyces brevispora]
MYFYLNMTSKRPKNSTISATLLVTAVVAAVVVLVTPSGGGDSDKDRPQHARPRDGVDLAARIDEFTHDTIRRSAFHPPTALDRHTISDGVGLYLDGRHKDAARLLAEVDFGVATFTDTATGRRFAEIADRARESARGWGRVYIDLSRPAATWSVQIPHPVADTDSEKLGVGAWRATPGGVMVLAGANRRAGEGGAADVAHRRDTVFHAVCAELVAHRLPGIQLHGYADSTEPDYDVIVSTGKGDHGRAWGEGLATALRREGFEVCRVWVRRCSLEGRTNVQGRAAATAELPFLHVEFSRTVRSSPRRTADAVTAIGKAARYTAQSAGGARAVWSAR